MRAIDPSNTSQRPLEICLKAFTGLSEAFEGFSKALWLSLVLDPKWPWGRPRGSFKRPLKGL
jgi:hypothetical protein